MTTDATAALVSPPIEALLALPDEVLVNWYYHDSRRVASALAACAKYADHPEHGPIARHLLKRFASIP